jgi:transcriptional regulator NrdR family protein
MNCPKCSSTTRIVETRSERSGGRHRCLNEAARLMSWYTGEFVARRRVCPSCKHQTVTVEAHAHDLQTIIEGNPDASVQRHS